MHRRTTLWTVLSALTVTAVTGPMALAAPAKPMCGYALTSAQASSLREVLDLHGVTVKKTADGAFVPMAQSMRGLIPLLLDKRSEFKIAEATPVATCPAG